MRVEFDASFSKCLDRIKDKTISAKVIQVIGEAEKASDISSIKNTKKLSGYSKYYRIRMGDYRLGFEKTEPNTIRFITLMHRKDIYRNFP